MKIVRKLVPTLLLLAFTVFGCQPEAPAPVPEEPTESKPDKDNKPSNGGGDKGTPNTPFTSIPDELVGTWYAENNAGPMTTNWEQGTFQGEYGFREYRTMVFTKDGKNAVEYTSEVYTYTDEVKQYMYKRIGTLEYKTNPNTLTFHVQSGRMRLFSSKSTGYKEAELTGKDLFNYKSELMNPEATSYTSSTNYLSAKRNTGLGEYSVKYTKVGSTAPGQTPDPGSLYSTPPTAGTYVKIADKYYPTVTIGSQEWMSVNYAGTGGMKDSSKPQFGTFYKFMDLKEIPVPAGWRIPSKQDFVKLLQSQGLQVNDQGYTQGEELQVTKLLGQLMAATGWLKQDGYATNKSGFNAVPANYKVQDAKPNGEGTRCFLWTSEVNSSENPVAFQIVQLSGETYASFTPLPIGYSPQHVPVRLVRDK